MIENLETSVIQSIPVDQIRPSRHQARKEFDEAALKGLADSIDLEGLINPITVRKVDEGYELVAGERRLRAVKLLGKPTIEAKIIQPASEAESAAKGLVENLQRQDLNPIEEAEGFQELNQLDPTYWTQEQIGKIAGRSRVYVTQSLGFLKMSLVVQDDVRRLTLNRSQLLELMRLSTPEAQIEAAQKARDLSMKETRNLVDGMVGKASRTASSGLSAQGSEVKKKDLVKSEPTAQSPEQTVDPLSDLWPSMTMNPAIAPINTWGVSCGNQSAIPAWIFWLSMNTPTPKASIKRWLLALADALGDTSQEEAHAEKVMSAMIPGSSEDFRQAEAEQATMRLPESSEDWAAVEALAPHGPSAVYGWTLGENSIMARKAKALSWQDLGETDPIAGCHKLLDSMGKMREIAIRHPHPANVKKSSSLGAPSPEPAALLKEGAAQVATDPAKNILRGLF